VKLSEFYKEIDAIAPKALSDEYCEKYGAYDNSGILVDCGKEIVGVLFSLDLSKEAIEKAIREGANLIITHHPAIYGKIGDIRIEDNLGGKLVRCIQEGISVIAMHLNLDCAVEGVDESLRDGIRKASNSTKKTVETVMHPLTCGGYGRAYAIEPCPLKQLKEKMEEEFSTKRILCYGEESTLISAVASFCGAGVDEASIAFAKQSGAEVFVSSDFKHHLIALALESGLAVIILPHYASENYGFKKYYEKIRRQIDIPCAYHTDDKLL